MSFKSGFVAILGEPNVGKSTLINTLIKEKVAIVSPKPQTTRDKIIGVYNDQDSQIVFIDTPGMHTSKNKLDEFMSKSIDSAKRGVDVILLVIDGSRKITSSDIEIIKTYDKQKVILVVNKIDLSSFEELYPKLEQFNDLKNIVDIVPLSAKRGDNIQVLIDIIKKYLPSGVKYFDNDVYTDKSVRYIVKEIVREKALWYLQDEVPHGIAVEIVEFTESENLVTIAADIICEKQSHKSIIIGKDGSMLKKIGVAAREDIEKVVNGKVMLKLFVKVREDWRDNNKYIKDLGYEQNDL
ncbi:MAG: GTPase Era [Clostridia bacterium]|nr:GTPase Era [Clostridia bacterium]